MLKKKVILGQVSSKAAALLATDLVILETSSEIIPNSIISFTSAQLMQIPGVLIATGKPTK